ncbi:MAG TPA: glycosyltransferase family 39 protein [Bacteroidia bacterium]|nr:glycosyltransferase family 39 protein [Bacteroidia bacterium]
MAKWTLKKVFAENKTNFALAGILLLATFLRFHRLGFQSLWLDELHTLIEANPNTGWGNLLFFLKCCDPHPILFFATEYLFLDIFGYNETVARVVPALAGVLSVGAIFLLGKELNNTRSGLYAALFTAINMFHINYSQEARPYIFTFLFCTLSVLYLIRLIREPSLKHALLYALMVLLMIYSHYFGLFALAAQGIIGIVFLIIEKENKLKLFRYFIWSAAVVIVVYLPWLPFLKGVSDIRSFWIQRPSSGFAVDYFYEYFGSENLLRPVLVLLLFSFILAVWRQPATTSQQVKNNSFLMAFVVCTIWIVVTFFIPYLRSLLVIPMLHPRYTFVVLPAFILVLSIGLENIPNKVVQYLVLLVFVILSLTDLFYVKRYYRTVTKTQFRELSEHIFADTTNNFPFIVEEATAWHHQYYKQKSGNTVPLLIGKKEALVDSILTQSSPRFELEGFWIIGVHGEKQPAPELLSALDSMYVQTEQIDLHDAWARLFVAKKGENKNLVLYNYAVFGENNVFDYGGIKVAPIWEKDIVSTPLPIKKGEHSISFLAKGDPLNKIYPQVTVFFNDKKAGSFVAGEIFEQSTAFPFSVATDTPLVIKLRMENDAVNRLSNEDRNAFIQHVMIETTKK